MRSISLSRELQCIGMSLCLQANIELPQLDNSWHRVHHSLFCICSPVFGHNMTSKKDSTAPEHIHKAIRSDMLSLNLSP